MHNNDKRTIERVRRILRERIRPAIEIATAPLEVSARPLTAEPEPFDTATAGEFQAFAIGDPWGPAWTTTWFRLRGAVPSGWGESAAEGSVAVALDIGFDVDGGPGFQCEGLVFTPDGAIVKGIHPRNRYVAVDGSQIDLFVEAAANPDVAAAAFRPTHLGDGIAPDGPPLYRLQRAALVRLDSETDALAIDVDVLLGWAEQLPGDAPRRARIIASLARACDVLDLQNVPSTASAAREQLRGVLESPAAPSAHHIAAIGHAHIDSAWLWPTRETLRKCTRTFSNVLALMDDYPEFRFACSQAQQYAWVEDAYPDLFARITDAVAAGRFIPAGGMWVESDTNMPGGEALVRQFVHGKRYFLQKFGVESEEVWLPDSFGYSAALPQIAALAGFRWFLTQKLAWNPTNKFPHHTFWWEGIDGTRLFSHMPPVDSYLSELTAAELDHATKNFTEHAGATTSVVPFGHGDGGGGPTALMLERARRQANLEGSPTIEHTTPAEYFGSAEAEYANAPTWVGELYLEAHRGTYTSQAAMKRGNRRSEHLLREAELWCVSASIRTGAAYPYDALDRLWKVVLLHQFHDILPGSGIAWVHREAAAEYERVIAELESIIADAIGVLAGDGDTEIRFNAAPVATDGVPALGASAAEPATASAVEASQSDDGIVLDNGVLRVQFDESGAITSILDQRHNREVVTVGTRANALVLHQDLPNAFDAWDIESHYRGTARELDGLDRIELEHAPDGAATVVVHRTFGASTAVQRATLRPDAAQVDFTIETDWHEAEQLLKVTFPVDVRAKDATSEIQFGHISRPTHENTSRDAEQFEICAHRWVHVGEPRFGVAIANDSTYGHDIRRRDNEVDGRPGTEIRLSLLRAPRYPDPEADQGLHRAAYSLVSGADIEDAIAAGLRLNLPVRSVRGKSAPDALVQVDGDGVVVESVKLAEDRSGDLIIRVYESLGARTTARIGWSVQAETVAIVDLLERALEPLSDASAAATLSLRPFQILTLRIARRQTEQEEIG